MAGKNEVADRTLEIVREFDAPRQLVWNAWTDPKMAKHWMGPKGFTATHNENDGTVGGHWRLCLHDDVGGNGDMWQGGTNKEVTPPSRLVFTFAWETPDPAFSHETLVTIDFEELGPKKTRMTFRQEVFANKPQRDGHNEGWNSTFDRLAEFLEKGEPLC